MKKTLISLVLVFALLSTCVFSAVFAAYSATSGNRTVVATVSAFGITALTVNDAELETKTINILPGESGVLVTTTVTGTPSVDARLAYTGVSLTTSGNWTTDGNVLDTNSEDGLTNEVYFPIRFTVTYADASTKIFGVGGTTAENYTACNDIAALASALKAAIEVSADENDVAVTKDFAKTVAITGYTAQPVVSWEWVAGAYDNSIKDNCSFTFQITANITQK